MRQIFNNSILSVILTTGLLSACQSAHPPKPRGYFRIALPQKEYARIDTSVLPYYLELPQYAFVTIKKANTTEPEQINLNFPRFNATIYLSYKRLNNNIYEILEDNRKLAFKHTIKAEAINEQLFSNPEEKVHGILFEIKGNTASPLQFYLTDSTKHFLRGSLYFNSVPNKDSLAPVIDYLEEDIVHLMETLTWKNN